MYNAQKLNIHREVLKQAFSKKKIIRYKDLIELFKDCNVDLSQDEIDYLLTEMYKGSLNKLNCNFITELLLSNTKEDILAVNKNESVKNFVSKKSSNSEISEESEKINKIEENDREEVKGNDSISEVSSIEEEQETELKATNNKQPIEENKKQNNAEKENSIKSNKEEELESQGIKSSKTTQKEANTLTNRSDLSVEQKQVMEIIQNMISSISEIIKQKNINVHKALQNDIRIDKVEGEECEVISSKDFLKWVKSLGVEGIEEIHYSYLTGVLCTDEREIIKLSDLIQLLENSEPKDNDEINEKESNELDPTSMIFMLALSEYITNRKTSVHELFGSAIKLQDNEEIIDCSDFFEIVAKIGIIMEEEGRENLKKYICTDNKLLISKLKSEIDEYSTNEELREMVKEHYNKLIEGESRLSEVFDEVVDKINKDDDKEYKSVELDEEQAIEYNKQQSMNKSNRYEQINSNKEENEIKESKTNKESVKEDISEELNKDVIEEYYEEVANKSDEDYKEESNNSKERDKEEREIEKSNEEMYESKTEEIDKSKELIKKEERHGSEILHKGEGGEKTDKNGIEELNKEGISKHDNIENSKEEEEKSDELIAEHISNNTIKNTESINSEVKNSKQGKSRSVKSISNKQDIKSKESIEEDIDDILEFNKLNRDDEGNNEQEYSFDFTENDKDM